MDGHLHTYIYIYILQIYEERDMQTYCLLPILLGPCLLISGARISMTHHIQRMTNNTMQTILCLAGRSGCPHIDTFFSIQHLSRHIFSIHLFLYTFFYTQFFYTTRFFLYNCFYTHFFYTQFSIQHICFYTFLSIHLLSIHTFYTTQLFLYNSTRAVFTRRSPGRRRGGCVTGIYYQLGFVQEYLYTQLPNFPRKT